jgi:hypothetical protein
MPGMSRWRPAAVGVTDYYRLLPRDAEQAWDKLGPAYQRLTGRNDYLDLWSGLRSVTVTSNDSQLLISDSQRLGGG